MKELFSCWKKLLPDLKKSQFLLLFFDYDGTLTQIVDRPQAAKLSNPARRLLKRLLNIDCFKVAIISGRSLGELKRLVGLSDIIYAGNHGMELEGPRIRFVNTSALMLKKIIDKIRYRLDKRLKGFKGLIIEDKGLSLSIHYRLVKKEELVREIFKILKSITRQYETRKMIKTTYGKKVYEVRPNVASDKGRIIQWLIARYRFMHKNKTMLPIYLGDDITDEDAFRVLRDRGIPVFVGEPKPGSLARYYLKDVVAVRRFLNRLISLRQY